MGVAPEDAEHYLTIIEKRIKSYNGSRWTVKAYRKLIKEHKSLNALAILTASMYQQQKKGYTVDAWELPRGDEHIIQEEFSKVSHAMNTKAITAQENDSTELVLKMMQWKNIHHVPILNNDLNLVGLLTWTDVEQYLGKPGELEQSIREIMKTQLITITEDEQLAKAKSIMQSKAINCLPVVSGKKLVGIITINDL
jgi:CBS domain-containing protein